MPVNSISAQTSKNIDINLQMLCCPNTYVRNVENSICIICVQLKIQQYSIIID